MGEHTDHDDPCDQGKKTNGKQEALFEGIHPAGFFGSFGHSRHVFVLNAQDDGRRIGVYMAQAGPGIVR